ncbi:MAG: hypothetical protein ACUVS2_17345 [Candidatus Flexifilum sp.]
MNNVQTLSPRQTFEDHMRPAHLLLRVYRLLNSNDTVADDGELIAKLRTIVGATADEELLLIYNDLFLGLVRERADIKRSHLLQRSLSHLLRQAIVASCTALDTYLPAALQFNLPTVIAARGRAFIPVQDKMVKNYFETMTFNLQDVLRLMEHHNPPEFLSEKVVGFAGFSYMGTDKGVHVCGALLGIENPWREIAARLERDEEDLKKIVRDTVRRRNDIVHRADRSQSDPGGNIQEVLYATVEQSVDTIKHVILTLDELIAMKMRELKPVEVVE